MSTSSSKLFSHHLLAWTQISEANLSSWTCAICTLDNPIEFVQCAACLATNRSLRSLLSTLQLPYKTVEVNLSATVRRAIFASLRSQTTAGVSIKQLVEEKTGYCWTTDSWKCFICLNYNPSNRVHCLQCRRLNYALQAIMNLSEWSYVASSEVIQEDETPESIDSYLHERLGLHRDFLHWTCPACTVINEAEFVQCATCLAINTPLQKFNRALKAHCKKQKTGFFERVMSREGEVDQQETEGPMLKEFLERKTGLDGERRMWICSQCTLRNSYEYVNCRVCERSNLNLKTVLTALGLKPKSRPTSLWHKAQSSYYHFLDCVVALQICPICEVGIPQMSLFQLTNCSHTFHSACVHDHILACVSINRFPIVCPASCGAEIAVADVQKVLSETEHRTYLQATLRYFLSSQASKIRACPTPDCTNTFEFDGGCFFTCQVCNKSYCLKCRAKSHYPIPCEEYQLRRKVIGDAMEVLEMCRVCNVRLEASGECPQCKAKYCIHCHVLFHANQTCLEYLREFEKSQDEESFVKFAEGRGFKVCKMCQVWVQKEAGCNHITCKCGHQFCYICGKDWLLGECAPHQFLAR